MFKRKVDDLKNKNSHKKIIVLIIIIVILALLFFTIKYFFKDNLDNKKKFNNNVINSIVTTQNKSIFNIRELNIKELKDRIVLLNIYNIKNFSYIFSLDIAKKLEDTFKNKIIIIDVITDDFELDTNTIINYIIKNNIERPTINISNFDIGNELRTDTNFFILVDKNGMIANTFYDNDINEEKIVREIENLISKTFRINIDQLPNISLEKNKNPESFIKSLNHIKYLNKIKDTEGSPIFIISDPKGKKVYLMTINGNIINQIGSGEKGKDDKNGINATFCYPSGLTIENNEFLYIADMCNNSIRKVNLKKLEVETLIENNDKIKKPIDLEILEDNLIISSAITNPLTKYNLKTGEISSINCEKCNKYISKLVKYNNNIYFINTNDYGLYRIDSDGIVEKTINFNELNNINEIKLNGDYNFNIDETGIYFVDKFNNRILRLKDNKIKEYSNNSNKNIYNLPTDIIDVRDKLYVINENNKKITEIDKNTTNADIINITFGYEYNKIKGLEGEFLDINDLEEIKIKSGSNNEIVLNLQYGYSFEKMAPQALTIFKEDKKNNSAILIKNYSKNEILENKMLLIPALEDNSTYYIKGSFYYCNFTKNTPCLINKYNRKILTRGSFDNNKIVVDFLY